MTTIDIRGMTLDEVMEIAKAQVIAIYMERVVLGGADMLKAHGATDEELRIFTEAQSAKIMADMGPQLADIRRSLSDWNAPTGKLQ